MFCDFMITPATLSLLSDAKSRSISAENFRGEPNAGALATEGTGANCARKLGRGWKISPSYAVQPGETFRMAEIKGSGVIQSMWMSGYVGRDVIIRMYWDDQEQPSVECPLSDFFAAAWTSNDANIFDANFMQLNSAMIAVNPNRGMNCFWPMPFRKHALITLENRCDKVRTIYYQVNYALMDVPEEAAYFHAQFRASTPLVQGQDHVILNGVRGRGHYVGTAMHVGLNGTGNWWGEGEVKFYMDGDEHPTICGTGTEDYFLGAYDWDVGGSYMPYNSLYGGMYYLRKPNHYDNQMRFSMYRWHIPDPVRFSEDLKVTIQDLGWYTPGDLYKPRRDDIYTVAYWYQTLPTAPFAKLPDHIDLDIS
jgi:hypothetical protein